MSHDQPAHPLRTALLAQVLGAMIAIGLLALVAPRYISQPLVVAGLQGVCSAYTSYKLEAPPWWHPIHLGFMPLAVWASGLDLAPGWYLGGFLLLLTLYWRVAQSRVPLYFSNDQTARAVASLLPRHACRIIDLGCGNGALLRRLAQLRPDCLFVGVEYAPLPWLWSRVTCMGSSNCRIVYGDLWHQPLSGFDLVYAFLSPVPMPGLWLKAKGEMNPGALLVSNTFAIPDLEPDQAIEVDDRRKTHLYCYRIDGHPARPHNR